MPDQFDVSLEDSDLLGEVELTTNLIIAASETDDHLTTPRSTRSSGSPRSRLTPAPGTRVRVGSAGREQHRPGAQVGQHGRVAARGVSCIDHQRAVGGHRRRW